MVVYCYCIMPSHIHMIFSDNNSNPSKLLGEFKTFTSKQMKRSIEVNIKESRKDWMLNMMKAEGAKSSNVKNHQFWQQHNEPIELCSNKIIDQKKDYIHNNPVVAGFVDETYYWKYSSAIDYCGNKGEVEICLV